MTPYASPLERAKALYRLPTAPVRNRTLEFGCGRKPVVLAGAWRGVGHAFCAIGAAAEDEIVVSEHSNLIRQADLSASFPFASQSFDLVVAHRTLDDLAVLSKGAPFDTQRLLAQIEGWLAAGGVVAGCVQNRDNALSAARRAAHRLGMAAPTGRDAGYSVHDLGCMLKQARFVDIRMFSLLPDCESPLRLIDIDPRVSRVMFRHELNAARLPLMSSVVRRMAVELGLYRRLLTRAIFFWARKRC